MDINQGDLVVSIRGCPGCGFRLGLVFRVRAIEALYGFRCGACGLSGFHPGERGAVHHHNGAIPLSWLKKIDPPAQPEHGETRETPHA